jgi:hypothetical protein
MERSCVEIIDMLRLYQKAKHCNKKSGISKHISAFFCHWRIKK